jgi:outer membrane receptor protein involved in Fe transport
MQTRLCIFTIALLMSALANAQVGGGGTIQGTITDPSGAVVVGAEVTATQVATGVQTTRKTTEAGFFVLTPLQPGDYTVTIKAQGFQTVTQEHVVLEALANIGLNTKLQLGNATQTVTVEGGAPLLHTEDATLGLGMANDVYSALPLAMNGVPRDPTQFVALSPGVNNASTQAAGPSTAAFNGGQLNQNEIYLEGLPLTSAGTQGDTRYLAFAVSVEAVEQFQVETNGAKAQFDGQGVENYVLKSGTNQFHGAAFEYFRNTALDARGFFPAATPVEHQNEFGANIGGPIKKNKLFFYGGYDAYRYLSGSIPQLQSIPTAAELRGDFSAFPAVIYNPFSTTCNTSGVCTRQAFQGNIIDPNLISKISKSFASYLPATTNGNIQNNYLASLPVQVDTWNTTDKIDWNLSDKHRLFGFYADGKYTTNFTGSLDLTKAGVLPLPYTQARVVLEHVRMAQIHDTYTISPNIVNQFSYSFNRIFIPLLSNTAAGLYPQKAGLTGLPPGIASEAFPDTNFAGTNSPSSWVGTNARAFNEAANTFSLQDNILWIKGKHAVTMGFQFQALQDNENTPLTGTVASFNFSNNETAGFGPTGTLLSTTGNSFASFLLGAVDGSGITQNAVAETGGRYKDYALFVQDDWKVSTRLTLNLGLRWDMMGTFYEVNNIMSFFNPSLPNPAAQGHLGALQFTGNGPDSCNCRTPVNSHYLNFGPRVGLAYRVNDKTVIRAGYSLTYVHAGGVGGRTNSRQGLSQLGYNGTNSSVSPSSGVPAYYWDNGVPAFAQPPPFLNAGYGAGFITGNATGAQTVTYGDPDLGGKPPYYQNWNFGIQRSINGNTTVGAAYSASVGHFLPGAGPGGQPTNIAPLQYLALGSLLTATATPTTIAQANAIIPGIALPFSNFVGTVGQMLRPYPQYGTISDPWANLANSSYHSLQVTLNRRFNSGLTYSFGYTFSKELDDIATPRNPFNDSLEKSMGAINHTHVATATFVYALPFGKGKHFDPSMTAVRAIVSDWMISGVYTFATGSPLAIVATACTSGGILGTCVPNYNTAFSGDVRINGDYGSGNVLGSSPTPYLNKAAFSDPAPFTVGNIPRTGVYGLFAPHNMDVDISLRRQFAITERVKLAIQADSFNINNAVHFGAPGLNPDAASFGTLSTQANQPRKLQFNARITF